MNPPIGQARIVQNCYVVPDLEQACVHMHRLYGVGPFLGGQPAELRDHVYRGHPVAPIQYRSVFVQSGEINVELYPEHPAIRAKYRQTREAAAGWDGRELIIPWSMG